MSHLSLFPLAVRQEKSILLVADAASLVKSSQCGGGDFMELEKKKKKKKKKNYIGAALTRCW